LKLDVEISGLTMK